MIGDVHARVVEDWPRQTMRLYLATDRGDHLDYLCEDGLWRTVSRTANAPDNAGIPLPSGAWEAIAGLVAPTQSERELAAVREALSVERARVDHILGAS